MDLLLSLIVVVIAASYLVYRAWPSRTKAAPPKDAVLKGALADGVAKAKAKRKRGADASCHS